MLRRLAGRAFHKVGAAYMYSMQTYGFAYLKGLNQDDQGLTVSHKKVTKCSS